MSQRRCGWRHPLLTSVVRAAGANLKNNAYLSLTGQEKAVLGRSVLADCFDSLPGTSEVLRRSTAAENLPPGSFGAWRRALCGRADPRAILRIRRGPVAPLPKSESGRKTGCTRVRPGLRLLSRTLRRPGRWSDAEALLPPFPGTSPGEHRAKEAGNSRLAPRTSAAEQGLEADSRQRGRQGVRKPPTHQPQRPETARRQRPPVTAGQLLTRGKASKGRA